MHGQNSEKPDVNEFLLKATELSRSSMEEKLSILKREEDLAQTTSL